MLRIKLIVGLMALSLASSTWAFDIPTGGNPTAGKVKAVTKDVAKVVTTKAINDKLAKENCTFTKGKTDQVSCDLNKILKYLTEWKAGLKASGVSSDFDIHAEASAAKSDLAWKRVSFIEDKLRSKVSYWDWYSHKTTGNGDKLKIWIRQN